MIADKTYPFELPPLPYGYNALEPYIDEATMHFHHDKHHKTYVDNLNKALEGFPEYQSWTLRDLLKGLDGLPDGLKAPVRNNGGGALNHDLYFSLMAPAGQEALPDVVSHFGGLDGWKKEIKAAAVGQFGSGFAWLALDPSGKFKILALPNQDNPLSMGLEPILGVDVWEHAYYLKYQNLRADYVDAWFNVINWKGVQQLLDAK